MTFDIIDHLLGQKTPTSEEAEAETQQTGVAVLESAGATPPTTPVIDPPADAGQADLPKQAG